MERSSRILLIVVSVVVVAAAAALLAVKLSSSKVVFGSPTAPPKIVVPSAGTVTRTFAFEKFNGVTGNGAWDITVHMGRPDSVVVTVPENVVDLLNVSQSGSMLTFGLRPGTLLAKSYLTAEITTSDLARVNLNGANRLAFSGFTGDSLSVDCSGASSVQGRASTFSRVAVDASGAASIGLRNAPARDASVHLSGAGQVEVTVQGGALAGSVTGAGKLLYWGNPSSVGVQTSGAARIEKGSGT
ncbi:MAG TPA: DUF2807 domain-containing protein [Spirochaetia bacterium]|nr:DUF2807 domain-containing protein [Spirochaetia bacterium]